ncbi:MAG: alpha-E domain-containing protein [Caldilineaceae bacterium]
MLSRVADNLYWMSRYLERAEHGARLLAVHLNLVLDQEEETAALRRHRVLSALYAPEDGDGALSDAHMVQMVAFQLENANSIVNCIRAARENARQVREQINLEMWQELNQLYLYLRNINLVGKRDDGDVGFFEEVIERIQLFQGVTDATMNHGQGWQFIQIGRFLERALSTAHLLAIEFDALAQHVGGRTLADEPTYLGGWGCSRRARRLRRTARSTPSISSPATSPNFCCSTKSFRARSTSPSSACRTRSMPWPKPPRPTRAPRLPPVRPFALLAGIC